MGLDQGPEKFVRKEEKEVVRGEKGMGKMDEMEETGAETEREVEMVGEIRRGGGAGLGRGEGTEREGEMILKKLRPMVILMGNLTRTISLKGSFTEGEDEDEVEEKNGDNA